MARPSMSERLWTEAFGNEERPIPYSSSESQHSGFAGITSPKRFLKDLAPLSHTQLYALAENCHLALKTAQDEYLHIEHLVRRLEQKEPPANPQTLLDPDGFEEDKEASLYSYKRVPRGIPYTRTRDGTDFYGFQEPFSQGGFVPTDAQYKRMRATAKNPNNMDDWLPIERDGKKLVPRLPRSPPPRQQGFTGALSRPSRKRRLVEQGLLDTDATTGFSDSDAFDTPGRRATRFLGRKIPPTRESSEAPIASRGSPAYHRQHKFMNNLTQSLMSRPASAHPSTKPALDPHEMSPSPSAANKHRRIINNKNHRSRLVTAPNPRSSPSPYESEEKKWTDASLITALNADHSFLHPDPAIALTWKNAILNASNPVRSYAMKRKWAWWREGGMDKRPRRGCREGTGEDEESQENEMRDESGMKVERENGSNFKREDEERGTLSHPATGLDSGLPRKYSSINEASDAKESLARKQQKDGQFTFKLDNPPRLCPSSSSTWTASGQGGREQIHKIERWSSPPLTSLTHLSQEPPNKIK